MVSVLFILTALLSMSCWKEISGLQMITQPNKTVVFYVGSDQTFTWNFILTEKDEAKELKVTFAHWSNEYSMIEGDHLVTFVRKPIGIGTVYKGNLSIAKRVQWVGDMVRGFVAFQLINAQAKDASDYGIRFCVDGFPPDTDESGFTLSVQDPPPLPPDAPKILKPNKQVSLELTRGNSTTLKCTASANPYPALTWHMQGGEIKQGVTNTLNSSSLIVTPINDSDFTSYICIAKNGIGFDSVTFMLNEKVPNLDEFFPGLHDKV